MIEFTLWVERMGGSPSMVWLMKRTIRLPYLQPYEGMQIRFEGLDSTLEVREVVYVVSRNLFEVLLAPIQVWERDDFGSTGQSAERFIERLLSHGWDHVEREQPVDNDDPA